MAAEWYYAKGDKQIGPVTEAEIRGLAQSGTLSSTVSFTTSLNT